MTQYREMPDENSSRAEIESYEPRTWINAMFWGCEKDRLLARLKRKANK
ncbi:MAG TPA: hypothetical protein VJH90_04370 [archaeon]|nr:hypothetical protein [archaeon]